MNYQELETIAKECGFTHTALLDCSTIRLLPEVRAMCASDKCHQYDANWACPPGCGTLEECEERIRKYQWGILVQTVGQLEDSLDFEGMKETEAAHKESFLKMDEILQKQAPGRLPLGTGCCSVCKNCTYPDAPCRFPEKSVSSMEAYGMLVTQVCQDNRLSYYYGSGTIAYTACFLIQ